MTIQNNTLYVSSGGVGYASGYPNPASFPVLAGWDQTLPYRVEFDFKIPDTNNHWFFVYVDPRVQTVIDYYNDFIAYGGGAGNRHILYLTAAQWYHVEYDVVPGWGYDVYVDGVKQVSQAPFACESYWSPFRIGDRLDGSYDLGSAYWDNFQITTNIPEPLTMGLLALSMGGLGCYVRRRLGH
jgi:hypothetical protein